MVKRAFSILMVGLVALSIGIIFPYAEEPVTEEVTETVTETVTEEVAEEVTEEDTPFSEEVEIDGIIVKVEADEGVFPSGSALEVREATSKEEKKVQRLVDEVREEANIARSLTYDIKILSDGEEIQPNGEVRVSFQGELVENENLTPVVYHTAEESEILEAEQKGDTLTAISEGFSFYTVEFTYGDKEYVIQGEDETPLSEILDFVGLSGNIEDAWGSNEELFSFEKRDEWYVISHEPFQTEEWMKVILDGMEYEIKVTDDINSGTYDGVPWRITDDGVLEIGRAGQTYTMTNRASRSYNSFGWYSNSTDIKKVKVLGTVNAQGSLYAMFGGNAYTKLESVDLRGLDASNATNMAYMFNRCTSLVSVNLSGVSATNVTSMRFMFNNCSNLVSAKLDNMNTVNNTDTACMFQNCTKLENLSMANFKTDSVTSMANMFYHCENLKTLDVSSFDTSNVTAMNQMFCGCYRLESLDLSSFNTEKVTTMNQMFRAIWVLETLNIKNFDTFNVTNYSGMLLDTTIRNIVLGPDFSLAISPYNSTNWCRVEDENGAVVASPYLSNINQYDNSKPGVYTSYPFRIVRNGNVIGYYVTLANAISAAQDGDVIQPLMDNFNAGPQNVSKKITIEGVREGQSITLAEGQTGPLFNVAEGGELTLGENITLKKSTNSTAAANKGFLVDVDGGKLIIDGGTVDGRNAPNTLKKAPIYIHDGEFEMKSGEIIGAQINSSNIPTGTTVQALKSELGMKPWSAVSDSYGNTVGAIIMEGGTGTIDGGIIRDGIADVGAILVKDGAVLTMNGGEITGNKGIHHSGAVQVENGGVFVLNDGEIKNNYTYSKGGAVWATEWGTAGYPNINWSNWPKEYPTLQNSGIKQNPGYFVMNGGEIHDNFAAMRAGAIEVQSDGVTLNGGKIYDNSTWGLGGAIYVEGDAIGHAYSLVIEEGRITGNTAKVYGHDRDFANGNEANGGGIWLCAVGGTAMFNAENDTVLIDGNTANRSGTDFYLSPGKGESLIKDISDTWTNEKTGNSVSSEGTHFNGPKSLINGSAGSDISSSAGGIKIYGNSAGNGGGIAANGSLIFGSPRTISKMDAGIDLTKIWYSNPEAIQLRLGYAKDNGTIVPIDGYNTTFNGTADEILDETSYAETEPTSARVWNGRVSLPSTVLVDGEEQPLFILTDGTTDYDPSVDMDAVSAALSGGKTLTIKEWRLAVEELDKKGRVLNKYILTKDALGSATIDQNVKPVQVIDPITGAEKATYNVNYVSLRASQTLRNSEVPTVEKYVNKAVHYDMPTFKSTFEYDILAYVPYGATSFQVNDVLEKELMFIDLDGKPMYKNGALNPAFSSQNLVKLDVTDTNNHKTTVSTMEDNPITGASVSAIGNTLVVTIGNSSTETGGVNTMSLIEGQWVRVHFNAAINPRYYDEVAKQILNKDGSAAWSSESDNKQGDFVEEEADAYTEKISRFWRNADNDTYYVETKFYDSDGETRKIDGVEVTNYYASAFADRVIDKGWFKLGSEIIHPQTSDGSNFIIWDIDNLLNRIQNFTLLSESQYQSIVNEEKVHGANSKGTLDEWLSNIVISETTSNSPVAINEDHEGIPNKATYNVTAKNTYNLTSNKVTVKPVVHPIEFVKQTMAGELLPGATLVIKDTDGNQIDEWRSTADVHKTMLSPGNYTIEEKIAPINYERLPHPITFTVDEDGNISDFNSPDNLASMEDKTKLLIVRNVFKIPAPTGVSKSKTYAMLLFAGLFAALMVILKKRSQSVM